VSLFHYHLNFPSLTRTGKSASFSGKKHRRKRHSALCCGHYLFRGIVKAVVIGGRGGEEARQEGWTTEGGGASKGDTHARVEGLVALNSRGRRRRRGTSSAVGIGEPRFVRRRRFSGSRAVPGVTGEPSVSYAAE